MRTTLTNQTHLLFFLPWLFYCSEHEQAGVSARLSLGQVFVDGDGDSFPVSSQQTAQRDPSRRSIAFAMSAIRLVDAGDAAGFESLVSGMSSSQRALVFSTGGASGSIGGDRSLVLVAVRRGELSLLQAVLRWIPQGKVINSMRERCAWGYFGAYMDGAASCVCVDP